MRTRRWIGLLIVWINLISGCVMSLLLSIFFGTGMVFVFLPIPGFVISYVVCIYLTQRETVEQIRDVTTQNEVSSETEAEISKLMDKVKKGLKKAASPPAPTQT